MKLYTLIFIKDKTHILLGKKRRGRSTGLFNGFGGKIESNETIPEAAQRELKEESNLEVDLSNLKYLGVVICVRNNFKHIIHIFVVNKNDTFGALMESDEMTPSWFQINDPPLGLMDPDNVYWYEHMVNEKHFRAEFWYQNNQLQDKQVTLLEKIPNWQEIWY